MAQIKEIKEDSFQHEVLESEIPVVVDFWAPWCGPCRMVAPVLEDVSGKMDGEAKFVKINTDESPQTAQRYNIMAIPSLLVFYNGEEVKRVIGYQSQEQLESQINDIIKAKKE